MPGTPRRGLARLRPTRTVAESSVSLRVIVLVAVLVALGATVAQDVITPTTAIAGFLLIPVAFWFSYRRREQRNIAVKVLLAVGMLLALGAFLQRAQNASSVDEARAMLAELFIWTQILHSFDLPRRKDLAYSMGSSLVLMAAAASLTLDASFILFLIPYLAVAAAWFSLSYRAQVRDRTTPVTVRRTPAPGGGPRRRPSVTRYAISTTVIALVIGIGVFAVVPRVEGIQIVAPPFQLENAAPIPGFTGDVVNPGLPQGAGDGSGGIPGFTPNAYPGFGQSVDLRVRGRLSDEIVMKVRAAQPALWRAQAYDTWDGVRWTASDATTVPLGTGEVPVQVPPPDDSPQLGPDRRLVQTFYIENQQPNIVFAATEPRTLFFPGGGLRMDRYGSIRAPFTLDPGVVYSVVSELSLATPEMLRRSSMEWEGGEFFERYTQVPASTPQRVIDLAHEITDPHPTIYGKTMAVEAWLKANTKYLLDIPPDPPNVDAVDHFLFETRRGYCEHISAAMVVMLRAVGIPSRFAVGYDPGERNLLTGYFEVRESDAHSWVEVHFPGFGWKQFDPTRVIPQADPGAGNTFSGVQVFGALGRFLGAVIPEPVRDAIGDVAGGVGDLARGAARSWPVTLLLTAAMIGLIMLASRLRAKRPRGPARRGASAAFESVRTTFAARGHDRPPQRTPSEYLDDLLGSDELARREADDLRLIVRTYERDRFAPEVPDPAAVAQAAAAAQRLEQRARTASSEKP